MDEREAVRDPRHVPVMRDRIVELLSPALDRPGSVFVDCTLGLGGHARALLTACPGARLVGIDRDPAALEIAGVRLATFEGRVQLVRAVFDELPEVLERTGHRRVQAILMDLGLSSMQIDRPERGFAYAVDAPLDMRMDAEGGPTAADVVNTYPVRDLARILKTYGEERFADRIARRIVTVRESGPIRSSAELVAVVTDAIPMAARGTGGHPAKRTFQALRIEVNRELQALEAALPAALAALAPGGRLAVLAYHSLEDRLVKEAFREACSDHVPRGLPEVPAALRAGYRLLTRGAERPSPAETATNPRAASARLRAVIRNEEVAP